jgi:hypothetical protein
MKKMLLALALILGLSTSAFALMEHTEIRGLWEIKGKIYVAPLDEDPKSIPSNSALHEIGDINSFIIEIGDRDFPNAYLGETELANRSLAVLEAFMSGGLSQDINAAIAQMPTNLYLYLPYMAKREAKGPAGNPTGEWFGSEDLFYDAIQFPWQGEMFAWLGYRISNVFQLTGQYSGDTFIDDVFANIILSITFDASNGLGSPSGDNYQTMSFFAQENPDKLKLRILTYLIDSEADQIYRYCFKLTMDRL